MTTRLAAPSILLVLLAATLLLAFAATPYAFTAANPSGTGQPGVECGDEDATQSPPGFGTDGFAHNDQRALESDLIMEAFQRDIGGEA